MTNTEKVPVRVRSMYGANHKKPMVLVQIDDKAHVTWSVGEARTIAHMLLESAETAEQDGFLVEHFMEQYELDEAQAALMLAAFRDHRKKWQEEHQP